MGLLTYGKPTVVGLQYHVLNREWLAKPDWGVNQRRQGRGRAEDKLGKNLLYRSERRHPQKKTAIEKPGLIEYSPGFSPSFC